jgi:hypothetical protein|tara:strand:+ start:162 stop:461 length:300 start_codon:yes stop_codon:yes gene_type:complete
MPDWSEGSVFVALGIAVESKELTLKGLKLIHEDGHTLAPYLISMLHKRFKSAKIIGSDEIESEEQVLGLIAECIDALEDGIKDSEIVEAFLADIAKDHH